MLQILGIIFAGLLGLAFGSFLNVCLSRWPQGESVVAPRSHCCVCNRTLTWWENIPLLSWLALRGRCRTCKTWIGWRYPQVEAAVGGLWAFLGGRWVVNVLLPSFDGAPTVNPPHSTVEALGLMILFLLLVGLAVLDAEHLWLPDVVTLPGAVFGLAFSMFAANQDHPLLQAALWRRSGLRALEALAAAGLILLIRWLYRLVRKREGLGLGDAKLMALLAAWLGLPGALLAFFVGVFLGSIAAIVLLLKPHEEATEGWSQIKLPLGTFLCIGGVVSALWGQTILNAYLRWAGF
jgi:leader peptidase (prepilin peptidase)/N-methyltransferase